MVSGGTVGHVNELLSIETTFLFLFFFLFHLKRNIRFESVLCTKRLSKIKNMQQIFFFCQNRLTRSKILQCVHVIKLLSSFPSFISTLMMGWDQSARNPNLTDLPPPS